MSLTLPGWFLFASAIALLALIIFPLLSNETRLAVFMRLRAPVSALGQDLRGPGGTLIVPAVVFLLVAGIGAATSYFGGPPRAAGSDETGSSSQPHSGPNGEMLANLSDYTRSIGSEGAASAAAPSKLLPDVNTMIERLAARLDTAPNDVKGWRMLGWSYFHTGRYSQAVAALAKAVELDPSSGELKQAYEEAKAKAVEAADALTAATVETKVVAKGADSPGAGQNAKPEAMPPREYDAAIRAMVDGLAGRLERSPRDLEGWTRLMRSRVVLGEREIATAAFRKALEVFKDDAGAEGKIRAAAIELGLKAE
jgi:cytochrome c-type biogenesis protein CcmH